MDYITCDNNTTDADATGNPTPNDISETGRNDSTPNSYSIATNDANDSLATSTVRANTNTRANPNTHKRKLLWYSCRRGGRKVRLQNFEYNGFSGPNPAEVSQALQTPFEFYSLIMTNDIEHPLLSPEAKVNELIVVVVVVAETLWV